MDFDPLKLSQAMEAMETIVSEAGQVVWAYYTGLMERGFSAEQALTLTQAFQMLWWATLFRSMGDKN